MKKKVSIKCDDDDDYDEKSNGSDKECKKCDEFAKTEKNRPLVSLFIK